MYDRLIRSGYELTVGHCVTIFFPSAACDPRRVKATGRGLQNKGVRVGETADFKLWTEGAGEGVPKVRIIGPG